MAARKPAVTEVPATDAGTEVPEGIASFEQLQAALEGDDRPIQKVTVLEWPGKPTFWLRALTGRDRDAIENNTDAAGLDDISAKIVARALVKPDGTALVPRERMASVERMLSSRQAGGLLRLQRVVRRLSKLDGQAIEELEQLLKDAPSASSGTD